MGPPPSTMHPLQSEIPPDLCMQEHGLRRLKAALASSDDPAFVKGSIIPFLLVLGRDSLCSGACKLPLAQVLEACYRVPGLLGVLYVTLQAEGLLDAKEGSAVGWLLLTLAQQLEDARTDTTIAQCIAPLKELGGAAATAAHKLEVVLAASAAGAGPAAGVESTANGHAPSGPGQGQGPMIEALEDLQQQAGGRHSNDHADFRSIRIMVTSDEVSEKVGRRRHAMAREGNH